jgi:hypothetical protein
MALFKDGNKKKTITRGCDGYIESLVWKIASLLDITSSKVQRRLKKAGKLGITAESFKTSTVSPVSHPIQPSHPDTPKLPFKET